MLGMIDNFYSEASMRGIKLIPQKVTQTLSEEELIELVPNYDGWIIGDDPATRAVFDAGRKGKLKAVVKWGVGVDNVDFKACKDFNIPVTNTPGMFGAEVADITLGYVIGLARETYKIDRDIRSGIWSKPAGISLSNKTAAVIGFGDIGKQTVSRLLALNMNIIIYDPYAKLSSTPANISLYEWPQSLEDADFVIVNCALTETSFHLLNEYTFSRMKTGVRIINVGRGPIIDEKALIKFLKSGHVHSAALDVFEEEPLPMTSELLNHPQCILGSHNSSNTLDAVQRTSSKAIKLLADSLNN